MLKRINIEYCPYVKEVTDSFCLVVQGEVCGLCGDFDGDGQNDFTTQGQLAVSNSLEFANSWKVSSSCPDVEVNVNSCEVRPNRHHWAKIMCSIITEDTFKGCHNKVMTCVSNLSLFEVPWLKTLNTFLKIYRVF